MFITLGLDSENPVKINGVDVRGQSSNTGIKKNTDAGGLFGKRKSWMHMKGAKAGKPHEVKMDCIAQTLKGWEDATCNVDTGMPCSIMAQFVKNGIAAERGVFGPEAIIPPEPFFAELAKRQMRVYLNGEKIN